MDATLERPRDKYGQFAAEGDEDRQPDRTLGTRVPRLREWRRRRYLSKEELAAASGVSWFTIWRAESNRGGVRNSSLKKLAAALDVSIEDLIDPADSRQLPAPSHDVTVPA